MAQIAEILDILEPLSIEEKEEIILEFFRRISLGVQAAQGTIHETKEKTARMLEHQDGGCAVSA